MCMITIALISIKIRQNTFAHEFYLFYKCKCARTHRYFSLVKDFFGDCICVNAPIICIPTLKYASELAMYGRAATYVYL